MPKNIFFILFALILIGGAVYFLMNRTSTAVDTATGLPNQDALDADIAKMKADLAQLQQIKDMTLDTGVFEDPLFQNLRQPQQHPVAEMPSGRRNPFAPF